MPRAFFECAICGYDASSFKPFTHAYLTDGKRSDCFDEDARLRLVCDGECHGLRLSWWQRRKIRRHLDKWTR
jgi:hypothetical protein